MGGGGREGGRGGVGWGAGCACRKVGKKTSTLDSIVPLSVILPPARPEKGSSQTDIAGVLSPLLSPVVGFICSWIVLDAACHVSY